MQSETAEADPRSCSRIECRLPARLTINGEHLADCIISDISGFGCRIHFSAPDALPPQFEIECDVLTRPMMAVIRWRSSDMLGARFLVAKPLEVPLPPRSIFSSL